MKKLLKFILRAALFLFLLLNIVFAIHAYKFTHYNSELPPLYKPPKNIATEQKIRYAILGVDIPRPQAFKEPSFPFVARNIQSDELLSSWFAYRNKSKGTVILCHGYGNEKSGMNNIARALYNSGYNTLQFDFRGAGASGGDQTTIGFKEAQNVIDVYHYIKNNNPQESVILYGVSMGAAAILKAMNDSDIQPDALILECPFGSMEETVAARFALMGVPPQPWTKFLVFWGGALNGFNAFGFKPTEYATSVSVPTLFMIGDKDQYVSMDEANGIYDNLNGVKKMVVFPKAKHENYLNQNADLWNREVFGFLNNQVK